MKYAKIQTGRLVIAIFGIVLICLSIFSLFWGYESNGLPASLPLMLLFLFFCLLNFYKSKIAFRDLKVFCLGIDS